MAKRSKTTTASAVADFRHDGSKRKNIPPASMAAEGSVPVRPRVQYEYNPHLPPALRWDGTGQNDALPELIAAAGSRALTPEEQRVLADALQTRQPWLEWAGKRESMPGFAVDPVALHLHERVSTQAILSIAGRRDAQRSLFADPQQPYAEAVQFYRHDVDWANRLILGDSLEVMASLSRREDLAGRVQMIYLDPPYGIRYASNFQPEVGRRDVKDKPDDFTRDAEQIRAFRDTWHLGVHSYLSYLRDRLIVAKELLADTGSIFVQISDENLHRVRQVMDEVFGVGNTCAIITFAKSSATTSSLLSSPNDFLLWYAKDQQSVKYHQLYRVKKVGGPGGQEYSKALSNIGEVRSLTVAEKRNPEVAPSGDIVFSTDNLMSQGFRENTSVPFHFNGRSFVTGRTQNWKTTLDGMDRLASAERIEPRKTSLRYRRHLLDYPAFPITSTWGDTSISGRRGEKLYVVQTSNKVIERCLLMTTDPGDLVLDPTCGSGTTAYVAEQWGRRWITIDTSRVAVALARQRLLTAKFDAYKVRGEEKQDGHANPAAGFIYETVPHVTLGSIARNVALDPVFAEHQPRLDAALATCNAALAKVDKQSRDELARKLTAKQKAEGKRAITDADRRRWELPAGPFEHWTVPFDTDPAHPAPLAEGIDKYRAVWRAKMDAVNAVIAAGAEQEVLVDRPQKIKGVVRVSGPFTVEAVQPPELSLGEPVVPAEGFAGQPEELNQSFQVRMVEPAPDPTRDPQSVAAYLDNMVRLLRGTGILFPGNRTQRFDELQAIYDGRGSGGFHAEGSWTVGGGGDAATQNVGVVFGPQHGAVTSKMIEDLIRPARRRFDALVVAGFSFTADAQAIADDTDLGDFNVFVTQIAPDANPSMEGLLKSKSTDQLFQVFGSPRIEVTGPDDEDHYRVEMQGVDIYDPVKNRVVPTKAQKVAAWLLDSDYDGRTFCVTQAFFPDRGAWDKLAKALKGTVEETAFDAFAGTESLPFAAGSNQRIAVKVIDPRGNEVMSVRELNPTVSAQ